MCYYFILFPNGKINEFSKNYYHKQLFYFLLKSLMNIKLMLYYSYFFNPNYN